MPQIKTAIYGVSGYGGLELARILLQHPNVTIIQATSRDPGRRLDAIHPGLRGLTEITLSESKPESLAPDLDAVFFALPHGESTAIAEAVANRCPSARLFDLAQDFRTGHESAGWVYGQPELFRDQIRTARKIACPGCFATAILLGTAPAIAAGLRPRNIIVDAKTGSSGSGTAPVAGTHHPTRASTLVAYKVFKHQHEQEIKASWSHIARGKTAPGGMGKPQLARASDAARPSDTSGGMGKPQLARASDPEHAGETATHPPASGHAPGGMASRLQASSHAAPHAALPSLHFVPQSTPLVRGIYACCYLIFDNPESAARMPTVYREFFTNSPFVRLVPEPPNVLSIRGTNNADIYVQADGEIALVIVSLDNLVKGASGQAVQCMNLAFNLPEDRGLKLPALVP